MRRPLCVDNIGMAWKRCFLWLQAAAGALAQASLCSGFATRDHCYTSRVVAMVFKVPQAIEQDALRFLRTKIADNSAHCLNCPWVLEGCSSFIRVLKQAYVASV